MTTTKKRKKELEVTAQKLAESTHKNAKAEKKTYCYNENIIYRVKCFKKKYQEIMKADVPKQEEEIKEVEKKLKHLN